MCWWDNMSLQKKKKNLLEKAKFLPVPHASYLDFYSCVELANLMIEKKEGVVFILIQLLIFSEKYAFLKLQCIFLV